MRPADVRAQYPGIVTASEVEVVEDYVEDYSEELLPPDMLNCLRHCFQLRVLILALARLLPWTDEDAFHLISSLPHLRRLEVSATGLMLMLRALVQIMESSPNIETIALKVDTTQPLAEKIRNPGRALREIFVYGGAIMGAPAIAEFMTQLSMQRLSVQGLGDLWTEVRCKCLCAKIRGAKNE